MQIIALNRRSRYVDLILKKIHINSILVLDDIHYSPEMERAWLALQVT